MKGLPQTPMYRTSEDLVMNDPGNDGYNTGAFRVTDRTIWIWPSKEWRLRHLYHGGWLDGNLLEKTHL